MRFPFILRSDHDEQVRLMNVVLSTKDDNIRVLRGQILEQALEIEALMKQLTEAPVSVPTADRKKHTTKILGRSGWRQKAQQASRESIKAAPDSAKQLEEKVKREGGNI